MFGIEDEYIDGDKKEVPHPLLCGMTTRHAMQTLGTEWGRKLIGKDLWVLQLQRRLEKLVDAGVRTIVVDDLRFMNENGFFESLRFGPYNYKVDIIKVRRNGCISDGHESEEEIDSIVEDWTLFNNSTIGNLELSIDDVMGGV